ncbi:MAG TPA: enoyl-CoA hydratase/isomerase family protein [Acidimicrobiales bacterium]|jgi:enoyl-CoA hydratase/carnithine racemase|nr:enoyl-CoA hydratase/isomerase family protein [Acidimicrobiales bacterium]
MTDPSDATITEADGIVTVTLDRQEKCNAITADMSAVLWKAANALADRDDLRCMVITAKGPYFTAGLDLTSSYGTRPGNPETEHLHPGWNFRRNYRTHHLLYDEFESIEKPIILAAQGHCLGAGLEMAVSCDFRFCTPVTEFGLPEIRIGVLPGSGGMSRVTRLLGPAWGKWLAMAGKRITATQAQQMGLVNEVFPSESFLKDVYAFCQDLMTVPAEVLGVTKLAVDMYADVHDRTAQRHIDRLLVTGTMDSPEYRERTARFRLEGEPRPD